MPAALAALVTTAVLLPFLWQLPRARHGPPAGAGLLYVLSLPPSRVDASPQPSQAPLPSGRQPRASANARGPATSRPAVAGTVPAAATRAVEPGMPDAAAEPVKDPVPEPERAASAPLRLDDQVIREASRASRSEARRLADASGVHLADARPSKQERLAASVAGTGKPACLEPGGSLLSIFVIAYQAAREACR